jgi:hypothetical protein
VSPVCGSGVGSASGAAVGTAVSGRGAAQAVRMKNIKGRISKDCLADFDSRLDILFINGMVELTGKTQLLKVCELDRLGDYGISNHRLT